MIQWRPFRQADSEQVRERRLERVLRAARQVPYYQSRLSQLHSWADAPRLPLDDFLGDPAAFYRHSGPRRKPVVQLPMADACRVAVLGGGFEESSQVRVFRYDCSDELAEYGPDAIAGPMDRIRKAALDLQAGRLKLPTLERAVVVFTGLRDGTLEPGDRELFWRAFRVPVYEQLQGFHREALASECDAHEGLHVETSNALFELDSEEHLLLTGLACADYAIVRLVTGLAARVDTGVCGCGWTGPRLLGLRAFA